ncbi:MAG TPA: hypothetical protein VGA55_06915 [Bacteroidota bacterium]
MMRQDIRIFAHCNCLLTLLIVPLLATAQETSAIPRHRVVDWSAAGVEYEIPRQVDLEIDIGALKLANQALNDDAAFAGALEQARAFRRSHPSARIALMFPSGVYTFHSGIIFDPELDSNLIIRGEGSDRTILNFTQSSGNLFQMSGRGPQSAPIRLDASVGFAKGSRTIKTESSTNGIAQGDFIELVQSNGPWIGNYDGGPGTPPEDVIGQIVRVRTVGSDRMTLGLFDELRLDYRADLSPRIRLIQLIRNVGIENFRINGVTTSTEDGGPSNFSFNYAVNCWLWGIESDNTVSAHVGIGTSSHIEVRGSYFHDATAYGGGGHGYGVSIGGRSTNCLVEDNIFSRLRHAMIISRGANGNVYGYNYSREQLDDNPRFPIHYREADISIHGHYPFANLFEGNQVTYVVADNWWGDNGPYNTLFRNFVEPGDIVLERADHTNVVGNELGLEDPGQGVDDDGGLTFDANRDYGSEEGTILDLFGFFGSADGSVRPLTHSESTEQVDFYTGGFLNDVSYYLAKQPSFLRGYSWPPFGPEPAESIERGSMKRSIPARDRWGNAVKTAAAPPLISTRSQK